MTDNIIILSDGTGNAASSIWRTNVWRTFQAIDLQGDDQAAKYDDGVGTSSFIPLAILGGAFGWGLKRNILDAYKFICRNYQPDSKLFFFGFSRGAFTVRVLMGLVLDQGLVRANSEAELDDLSRKAYRSYRADGYHSYTRVEVPFRKIRDQLIRLKDRVKGRKPYDPHKNTQVPSIEFVGVWDTVAAYGLPIDEITRGISNYVWPLELPNRVLSPKVRRARHALALDEERTTFHPVLWTEANEVAATSGTTSDQRLVQVWFAGVHSNVGGGYPDDALAFVPLYWMINEAKACGLRFKSEPDADPDTLKTVGTARDKDGRQYDSRAGLGAYYRYGPRNVDALCNDKDSAVQIAIPKIHESVFRRIASGCNAYAPIGLPATYAVVTDKGYVMPPGTNPFETTDQATARTVEQERLWNYVWMRKVVYLMTVAATFHLAAFWLFHSQNAAWEFSSPIRLVSESARVAEALLPACLHWWTDWYAGNPEWFAGGLAAVAILSILGSSLSSKISDFMRIIWKRAGDDAIPDNAVQRVLASSRTSPVYKSTTAFLKRHGFPALSVLVLGYALSAFFSHLLFNLEDSLGGFCTQTAESETVKVNQISLQSAPTIFDTSALCAPTGLIVRQGFKYQIIVEPIEPWKDDSITTDPLGYHVSSQPLLTRPLLYLGIPFRRVIFRPYFMLIARIGGKGVDEYFDPIKMKNDDPFIRQYKFRFVARRDGEVFLYVNDAVVGLPWMHSIFYGNNSWKSKITASLIN